MNKEIIVSLLLALTFLGITPSAWADYVLPYPSTMPGNKLYKMLRVLDEVKGWWYWGSIASFKYHLKLADKYLVESKTLFEYKQYLLAVNALERSDDQFKQVSTYIVRATEEQKNVIQLQKILKEAAAKHVDILSELSLGAPDEFIWTPEREKPTTLDLRSKIHNSILIRQRAP